MRRWRGDAVAVFVRVFEAVIAIAFVRFDFEAFRVKGEAWHVQPVKQRIHDLAGLMHQSIEFDLAYPVLDVIMGDVLQQFSLWLQCRHSGMDAGIQCHGR